MKTKHRSRHFRRFLRANEAVSALEYAILVGVVAAGIAAVIGNFSTAITDAIDDISTNISDNASISDAGDP